jgi:hypothetical protein
MTEHIFKYHLDTVDIQSIDMPLGAKILSLQTQNEIPCLWALVDTEAIIVKRTFRILGTGHQMFDNIPCKYIGTYQLIKEGMVFHCFELVTKYTT